MRNSGLDGSVPARAASSTSEMPCCRNDLLQAAPTEPRPCRRWRSDPAAADWKPAGRRTVPSRSPSKTFRRCADAKSLATASLRWASGRAKTGRCLYFDQPLAAIGHRDQEIRHDVAAAPALLGAGAFGRWARRAVRSGDCPRFRSIGTTPPPVALGCRGPAGRRRASRLRRLPVGPGSGSNGPAVGRGPAGTIRASAAAAEMSKATKGAGSVGHGLYSPSKRRHRPRRGTPATSLYSSRRSCETRPGGEIELPGNLAGGVAHGQGLAAASRSRGDKRRSHCGKIDPEPHLIEDRGVRVFDDGLLPNDSSSWS